MKCRREQTELEFEVVHLTSWLCYLITHRMDWSNWFKKKTGSLKIRPKVTLQGSVMIEMRRFGGGLRTANVGDYIIKKENGEIYSVNEKIFEKTYEKVW